MQLIFLCHEDIQAYFSFKPELNTTDDPLILNVEYLYQARQIVEYISDYGDQTMTFSINVSAPSQLLVCIFSTRF